MKILTIAATPFFSDRGCHIRIFNEAKYLQKMGARVRLCTYHLGEDISGLDTRRTRGAKWYKKKTPGFSWGKIWLDLKLLFLVRREIRKFRPDVIHAHLFEGLAIGFLAKKIAHRDIPIVLDLQGNIDDEFESYNSRNSIIRKIFVPLSKRISAWADKVVMSSENVDLQQFSKTSVIRDGIDLEIFKNTAKLSQNEEKRIQDIGRWAGEGRLLVYVGGLSDSKGAGKLLESFLALGPEKIGNWKLLMGGYGEDEEKYKKIVREHGFEGKVYFAGRVKYFSLPRYLEMADAAIDPKKDSTESSGKIISYMAAGLPIICFENSFNRTRLGENGFYLKKIDELGSALQKIPVNEKISYDLENLSEEKEMKKLFDIFQLLKSPS